MFHAIRAALQACKDLLGHSLSWDIFVCRRNELVALDLFLTAVATAFAFVSMVGEGPDIQISRTTSCMPTVLKERLRSIAVVSRWNIWDEYATPDMVPGVNGEHGNPLRNSWALIAMMWPCWIPTQV